MKPNIISINNNDQVLILAFRETLQIFQNLVDLCNVLDKCIVVFLGGPIDESGCGIVQDSCGEKELAEVLITAGCRYEEVEVGI